MVSPFELTVAVGVGGDTLAELLSLSWSLSLVGCGAGEEYGLDVVGGVL